MRLIRGLFRLHSLLLKRPPAYNYSNGTSFGNFVSRGTLLTSPIKCRSSVQQRNMSSSKATNIIWIDLELTGLDPETCHIIEVACIVTDRNMNVVAEGPDLVLHQPAEVLNAMNDWCLSHHKESGLFKESLESKVSLKEAEDAVLQFVETHTIKGMSPLAGNTVYMDKWFLLKYMPKFCQHLHYRILDVSSVKILAKSWYDMDPPPKMFRHRALDDIKESIAELKHYQEKIFQPVDQVVKLSKSS